MKKVRSWPALAALFIACISFSVNGGEVLFREEIFGTSQALRHTYTNATRYNETTFLTSHNAFSIQRQGWIYYQQSLDFDAQFAYGVWSFMLDLHWCYDNANQLYVALAHNQRSSSNNYNYTDTVNRKHLQNCAFSGVFRGLYLHESFEGFLRNNLHPWLSNDPDAIITLHLESYLGLDGANTLHDLFEKTGLLPYLYTKTANQPWPTLGEMRAMQKRLVVFSDNRHDALRDEVFHTSQYRETQYNLQASPHCEPRYDNRNKDRSAPLLVLNHFYTVSYGAVSHDYHQINNPYAHLLQEKYTVAKAPDLATRTFECLAQEGILPTFIAVDFVEEGDCGGAREWVLALNTMRHDPSLLSRRAGNYSGPFFIHAHAPSLPSQAAGLTRTTLIGSGYGLAGLCLIGSLKLPCLKLPSAVLGTLSTVVLLDSLIGSYVPAPFAPLTHAAKALAVFSLLKFLQTRRLPAFFPRARLPVLPLHAHRA